MLRGEDDECGIQRMNVVGAGQAAHGGSTDIDLVYDRRSRRG